MTESASYDPRFFAKIAAVEEKHFWFCARARIIRCVASQVVGSLQPGYRFIEVGCGTGMVLRELVRLCKGGNVSGIDLFPEAVAFASKTALCPVMVGDVEEPTGFGEADVVGTFDVLEHLPDDRKVLNGLNQILKPGGKLILTVPAHMSLWSYFDVASRHYRRYTAAQLEQVLRESGFEVEYVTEFMMSLFPLLWLGRRLHGRGLGTDRESAVGRAAHELAIVPVINGILKLILSWETIAIRRRWRLPIGTSLLAVSRKRQPTESEQGSRFASAR
jgi:2-polyprenyl-3-methyl-5-hydroxy-6-metoxy-1,4-benzoquinol methylase